MIDNLPNVKINPVNSIADIVRLLNLTIQTSERITDKTPITINSFLYFSSPSIARNAYKTFRIKKKSGGTREINAPVYKLKKIQEALSEVFQNLYHPHQAANGFVKKKSIVLNAQPHIGQNYVFNTDLKDFFSSIDQARVWKRLQFPPFNLSKEAGRLEIANRIAAICCTEMEVERFDEAGNITIAKRNVLPQGAPTSPVLSNIIAQRLDYKLTGLANRFGLNYTRYADDITFSSKHNVYQKGGEFLQELDRIVVSQNFRINHDKTRLQKRGFHQEVTGLIVNEKPNVKTRYIKQLRMWISYWEKYGYNKAEEIFLRDYIKDKGHVKKHKPDLVNVLNGKLLYLKMVKGDLDPTYCKLSGRFFKLRTPQTKLSQILQVWEQKGLDSAIVYFNNQTENR